MKVKIIFLFFLCSFGFFKVAFSEIACNNIKNSTSVYYINGINNTEDYAAKMLEKIQEEYSAKLAKEYPLDKISFALAYNETYNDFKKYGGIHHDYDELKKQKWYEQQIYFKNKNRCVNCDDYEYWYQHKLFHDVTKNLDEINDRCIPPAPDPAETIRKTFAKHTTFYKNDLEHGKRIILIAHSQGNLYANMALRELRPKYTKNVGMIGLGSVAGYQYSNTFYYTSHDDIVVNLFRNEPYKIEFDWSTLSGRILYYKILPGNIKNYNVWGSLGERSDFHEFYSGYFRQKIPSRAKVDEKMHYYLKTLEQPKPILQLGALMVTLTWDNNTDVDLHIKEPNGTNVFYSNKNGDFGKIDVDNTVGKGPEHYVVPCSSQIEGEYEVGINYYSGSTPEKAKVQITTENGDSQIFEKILEKAKGNNGSISPVKIAKIKVFKNSSNKYIYQITGLGE